MSRLQASITSKHYTGTDAAVLEDIGLVVGSGEFVAIVGPSGAGKSTLLNIIGGLDNDFDGEVVLNRNGDASGRHEPERPRIGMMFQSARLMPWLSVLDNLCLVSTDEEVRDRALALLHEVELGDCADAYPGQLSGGMRRRVALARAFVVQPQILLMDEPFISLDAPTAERLRRNLVDLWERARPTVLFVTHDLREAVRLADRVVFFSTRPGRIVLDQRIDLERPRAFEDAAVGDFHDRLLAAHPKLLSGLTESRDLDASDL